MSDCIVIEDYAVLSDAFAAVRGTQVADALAAADAAAGTRGTAVADAAVAGDSALPVRVLLIVDAAVAGDGVVSTSHRSIAVVETLRAADAVRPGRVLAISDAATAADTVVTGRSTGVADHAVIGDAVAPASSRVTMWLDSAALTDSVRPGRVQQITDTGTAGDSVHGFRRSCQIQDAATIADALASTTHRVTVSVDRAVVGDSVAPQAHHRAQILDRAVVADAVYAPGQLAAGAAWTTALDTLNAARWTAQPVVAAAVVDGHPVVATPQGLYELTGTTDAGADIAPYLRLPISDLGSRALTRIDHVYATTQGGPFVLAVTPMDQDQPTYEYEAAERTEAGQVATRVKVGRGLRSLMWQLEFRGIPGAPFALRSADITLIDTSRRV